MWNVTVPPAAALLTAAVAAAWLWPASLRAQAAPDRGVVLGWVEAADGGEVAGADVVLFSRPLPERAEVGAPDRVEVKTDARGRFRARCLRGNAYVAWATFEQDGQRFVTAVQKDVVPGPPVQLTGARPVEPVEVTFQGLGAWQDRGPLQFSLRSDFAPVVEASFSVEDGRATLPFVPRDDWWLLTVRAADGLLLRHVAVTASSGSQAVSVSRPVEVQVELVDAQGLGQAAVRVLQDPRRTPGNRARRLRAVPVGVTDQDGVAAVVVPHENPGLGRMAAQTLRFEREGLATTIAPLPPRGERRFVRGSLGVGYEVAGRIVDADGAGVAGVEVLCDGQSELLGQRGQGLYRDQLQRCVTDAAGAFCFEGVPAGDRCRISVALSAARAAALGVPVDPGLSFAPVHWLATARDLDGDADLGALRLDGSRLRRVDVRTAGGAPAVSARVMLVDTMWQEELRLAADRVGRLQVLLPPGEFELAAWVEGGGVALLRGDALGDGPVTARLSAPWVVAGRVVDEAGAPVAGAVVSCPRRVSPEVAGMTLPIHAALVAAAPTGPDGRFRITLPTQAAKYVLRATVRPQDGPPIPSFSRPVTVAPDTAEVELVIQG